MTTPAERLCSRSWRLRNSLWLAPAILLFGFATWASFLYIGIKAKRKAWLIAAGLYGVAAVILWVFTSVYSDGSKETGTTGESLAGLAVIAVWLGGVVHGLIVNRQWLRWKAHAGTTSWYAEPSSDGGVAPEPPGPSADDLLLGRGPSTAVATPPPPPLVTVPNAPSSESAGPAPVAMEVVDLNSASTTDLETQLGLDPDTAQAVTAARTRIGGFASTDQLMTEAGLEPHRFVSIRDRVTVTATPRTGSPSRGRRLDL